MRVLEDALRVVWDLDPEVLPHQLIPLVRQIAQRDAAVADVLFELEAQDDVHPIGDLVGLNADQRRAHTVDPGEEGVERDASQLLRERLLRARIEERPERTAAADEVLPQPALRLVNPK